jgi:CDP-diacylglycerol---glycerol-3-phosphate 3-phosphatidyltransferase
VFPLNVPNVLTVIRILLVPVLVAALLVETRQGATIAAIVFVLAAVTDGLDGYIARSRRSVTTFGKVMDPIADKLLITAALIALVSLDRVAAWVAMVIIAREFAVSSLRVAAAQQGAIIPASLFGKAKTVTQVAAVLALIAASDPHAWWVHTLVYVAVVATVGSGVDYFLNVRREIEQARATLRAQRLRAPAGEASRSSSSSREVPRM